jgi:hypothetical protein
VALACDCLLAQAAKPERVIATWFGITNHFYQVGDISFMQDGAVSGLGGDLSPDASVALVWRALAAGGATAPEAIFVGHDHGDHSQDVVRWAQTFPEATVYGPMSMCAKLIEVGLGARCEGWRPDNTDGTTVIRLGEYVEIRPFRWLHSSHNLCVERDRPDTPTFAYLISVDASDGRINILSHDSGTSVGLTHEIVDDAGVWTAPFESLTNAMKNADVERLDLWQGGSENRLLRQARLVVPLARPVAFQPQHWADRDHVLSEGIGWNYFPGRSFEAYLSDHDVAMLVQDNFFAGVEVRPGEIRVHSTAETRAVMGLPSSGPGPREVVSHPRLADLPSGECPGD